MAPMHLILFSLLTACTSQELSKFNSAPSVTIIAPEDGSYVDPDGLVEFIAQAGDGQTDPPDLGVLWTSDVDGVLDETPPDPTGKIYFATNTLTAGPHGRETATGRPARAGIGAAGCGRGIGD